MGVLGVLSRWALRVVNPSRKEGKCHMVNLENASAKMRKKSLRCIKNLKNYPIVWKVMLALTRASAVMDEDGMS